MISIDDFKKVEMKVGEILLAQKVENADKLLRLSVDFGEKISIEESDTAAVSSSPEAQTVAVSAQSRDIRQIISGIAFYYPDPQKLIGKKCIFVSNLESRIIKGFESNGMIMAVSSGDVFSLLEVETKIPAGTSVK